jgi:hypothetical protein
LSPTDRELREIGRIAVSAGSIDLVANELLFVLINPQRIGVGEKLVSGERTNLQLKRIADLAPVALDRERDLTIELRQWARRADKALEDRNQAIHAGYYPRENGRLGPLTWKRGGILGGRRFSVRELAALADRLDALAGEGDALWNRVSTILRPSY